MPPHGRTDGQTDRQTDKHEEANNRLSQLRERALKRKIGFGQATSIPEFERHIKI